MNIPALTFENSPIYVGALLTALILILILRKPIISLFKLLKRALKSIKKSIKACKAKRKLKNKARQQKKAKLNAKKEAIMLKKMAAEPIIKTVIKTQQITTKYFLRDWTTGLFTIIGTGIITSAFLKNWTFLTSKYVILQELVYNAVNNMNLTTAIITIVFAGILILIADIFEIFQRNKSLFAKIFTILFFSALTSTALVLLLQTILIAKLNLVNTLIMGTVFVISGFLFNMKRIFKKEKRPPKEKEVILIKEDPLQQIKEVSKY